MILAPGEAMVKDMIGRNSPSEKETMNVLMPLAGTWDYLASLWTKPGAEPERSTGAVTSELILDRRFLSSKAVGSLNVDGQSMPWDGQGLLGYDNAKKAFTSVWVDITTTGMMIGSGKFDQKAHALAETGRFTNPLTGIEQSFRSELRFIDSEHYKRTIFAVSKAGKETKLMEIDYSRRK